MLVGFVAVPGMIMLVLGELDFLVGMIVRFAACGMGVRVLVFVGMAVFVGMLMFVAVFRAVGMFVLVGMFVAVLVFVLVRVGMFSFHLLSPLVLVFSIPNCPVSHCSRMRRSLFETAVAGDFYRRSPVHRPR